MRLFLCLCFCTPIYRATVLCLLRRQNNGGSGGAAERLAGLVWFRYSYPRLGYHPQKSVGTLVVAPLTKLECAPCSNSGSRRSAVPIKNPISIICPLSPHPSTKPVASSPAVLFSFCQPVSGLAGWPHESGAAKHPGPAGID